MGPANMVQYEFVILCLFAGLFPPAIKVDPNQIRRDSSLGTWSALLNFIFKYPSLTSFKYHWFHRSIVHWSDSNLSDLFFGLASPSLLEVCHAKPRDTQQSLRAHHPFTFRFDFLLCALSKNFSLQRKKTSIENTVKISSER